MLFIQSHLKSLKAYGFTLVLGTAGFGEVGVAVTNAPVKVSIPFVTKQSQFRSSLNLPLSDHPEEIQLPRKKIKQRALESKKDSRVEPMTLIVNQKTGAMESIAEKIAKAGSEQRLLQILRQKFKTAEALPSKHGAKTLELDENVLRFVNARSLSELFKRTHHRLVLEAAGLPQEKEGELLKQLTGFLDEKALGGLRAMLNKDKRISIDKYLLPDFPKKMIKKYIKFRGPNCFHAALAFHGGELSNSPYHNVKKEQGYHQAMVNYDELWRVLQSQFYEVDAQRSDLKYGDMIVFFDVPKSHNPSKPLYFKWIRHTATYLFNGYTFSKGSKSPNTPYIVRTLSEEWTTWQKFSKNLGVKVFRRSQIHVRKRPPKALKDWIY